MIIPVRCEELPELAAFEAGTWNNVEDPVASISVGGSQASAFGFQVIHILGIELRTDSRQIAVRDGNTIDLPRHSVAATRVQVIVHDECAGYVVGDHGQAAGSIGV